MLAECARRYLLHFYVAWLGWRFDAPAESRAAYRAKQLTSVPVLIGQEVHGRAREMIEAIRNGQPLPPLEDMIQRTRSALNGAWTASRDIKAFHRSPKRHPMLIERYFNRPLSNDMLGRYRARIPLLHENLYQWPGWDEVRACAPADVIVYDATDPAEFEGHPLYAAPDLVFRTPEGEWIIVDYKTGKELSDEDREQVELYYLYLVLRGVIAPDDAVTGCLVGLSEPHEERFPLGAEDLERAKRRVRESTWEMRGLVKEMDANRNEALPAEHFPLTPVESRCTWCSFQEICGVERDSAERRGPF
jgi:CRISPR/Cas system-associated exonuclease Cas4 (RecB family)